MNSRPPLTELTAFTSIVRHASFRAAAGELALSASTLSHMMRALEERLGVRLLNRTTRSVAPTEAGERLFRNLTTILGDLDTALADIDSLRARPSGSLRINASEAAARVLLHRVVPTFVARYPEIRLDLVTEGRLIDIVAEGFDAGVRLAETVPQDMIAVPFGGDTRFLAVAAPVYLAENGSPQTPDDLKRHHCIRFRLPSGKIYRWEFKRNDRELRLDVAGAITLDHMGLMVEAASRGLGIAYVWAELAREAIARKRLVPVLERWTPLLPGHCLYYPSHRLVPPPLRAFIDVLKELDRRPEPKRAAPASKTSRRGHRAQGR
jgi:DNA-binding transcriptional LysR family regulator